MQRRRNQNTQSTIDNTSATHRSAHHRRLKGKRRWILLLSFCGLLLWNVIKHGSSLRTALINSKKRLTYSLTRTPFPRTFWSSDFHISPIADVKDLFREWNVTRDHYIIDESLSGQCHLQGTCATDLKVLTKQNGISLGPCPNELKREFWRIYKDDKRMATVDAFFCHHVTGLCEVFMAFGRPMIIQVSTRYEIGRRSGEAWKRLNENLRAIAANPRNAIVANNLYDAEYLKHFTGLSNVKVLPNYCGYPKTTYNPSRSQVLIAPVRLSYGGELLVSGPIGLLKAAQNSTILAGTRSKEFAMIRQLYQRYNYSDLAAHPAIVVIPYQVSIMSLFEYYRMGIPLFVPSIDLLTQWQNRAKVMNEISWNCVFGRCQDRSAIPGHPNSPHGYKDPNDLNNFRYWIQFADFYQWPHITYFDDFQDLFEKLATANLDEIHKQMMAFNAQQKEILQNDWRDILEKAFQGIPPRSLALSNPDDAETATESWEEAVLQHYPNVSDQVHCEC